MQACLQKNDLQMCYLLKVAFLKPCVKMDFKNIIYKIYSLIFKGLISKPYFYLVLCKQSLLLKL
jgi:hypothetical protein